MLTPPSQDVLARTNTYAVGIDGSLLYSAVLRRAVSLGCWPVRMCRWSTVTVLLPPKQAHSATVGPSPWVLLCPGSLPPLPHYTSTSEVGKCPPSRTDVFPPFWGKLFSGVRWLPLHAQLDPLHPNNPRLSAHSVPSPVGRAGDSSLSSAFKGHSGSAPRIQPQRHHQEMVLKPEPAGVSPAPSPHPGALTKGSPGQGGWHPLVS